MVLFLIHFHEYNNKMDDKGGHKGFLLVILSPFLYVFEKYYMKNIGLSLGEKSCRIVIFANKQEIQKYLYMRQKIH